jgi:hypothetical protein
MCSLSLGWCEVIRLGPFRKITGTGSAFRMLTTYILMAGEEIKQFSKKLFPDKGLRNLHRIFQVSTVHYYSQSLLLSN